MVRITAVEPLSGFRLRLALTDGRVVERDVKHLLRGKLFAPILRDHGLFQQVTVVDGTVEWPNGADLCPDVVIWGGPPPADADIPVMAAPEQYRQGR